MDDRCGNVSSLGTWAGEQLHDGRVHPCLARDRNCCDIGKGHPGPETPLAPLGGNLGAIALVIEKWRAVFYT